MSRKIQDRNFLVWEVYPSGGEHGFSDNPHVIFNCLTQQDIRPRYVPLGTDAADAQNRVAAMSDAALLGLLEHARNIT